MPDITWRGRLGTKLCTNLSANYVHVNCSNMFRVVTNNLQLLLL